MENTLHTPGPWHQSSIATDTPFAPGTERHAAVSDVRGNIICQIALKGTAANDNANARLIAAAPELLRALEALVYGTQNYAPFIDAAKKAIAKAKGGAA